MPLGRLSHMARRASGSNQEMQGSSVWRGGGSDGQIHKTGGALYGVLKRPGYCWLEGRKEFDVTASHLRFDCSHPGCQSKARGREESGQGFSCGKGLSHPGCRRGTARSMLLFSPARVLGFTHIRPDTPQYHRTACVAASPVLATCGSCPSDDAFENTFLCLS